ncbi:hypothetical protein DdX_18196 [Ditylenchus destructor]|uniref:Uncharacterized protein n=1 Tax=Ditylenchus destructor TaxID=166010 RepID=A0AAD4MPY7_9BILA|nr:hypothetical protein DdX_18196 [Ditylenchus destructor]
MRNYRYSPAEEAQMDEFGKEWKRTRGRRGIKGPLAWREFKRRNPWAMRITSDSLRQKYTHIKKTQYWAWFARRHANCPFGHAVCYAGGFDARPDYDAIDDIIAAEATAADDAPNAAAPITNNNAAAPNTNHNNDTAPVTAATVAENVATLPIANNAAAVAVAITQN